jgi:hypothetical protein
MARGVWCLPISPVLCVNTLPPLPKPYLSCTTTHPLTALCPLSYSSGYISPAAEQDLPKVAVDQATLEALQALAAAQGKSVAHVASEALQQLASK